MSIAKHLAEAKSSSKAIKNDWLNLTIAGAARVILLAAASLLLWALIPGALGWHVTTTMSGSMEPKVMTGDVVVSMPYDGNKVMTGQVILAPDPAKPDHLRFHRVLKPGPNGTVITKGDNNAQADSDPTKRSAIVGVGVIRIPGLGLPALWMQQHQWMPLGVALLGLPLLFLISGRDRYLRQQLEAARRQEAVSLGRDPDPVHIRILKRITPTKIHHTGPQLKAATSIVLVLLLVGGAVTLRGSESGFASIDSNTGNSTTTPDQWDCMAPGSESGIAYTFNDSGTSNTTVPNVGLAASANGTMAGATKSGGNCTSSPYITLSGSSSSVTSAGATTVRNNGASVAFKTTQTTPALLVAMSNTKGTGASTGTYAGIMLNGDGTATLAIAAESTNGGTTCQLWTTSKTYATLNDGAWHYLSVQRRATSSSQTLTYYMDGTQRGTTSSGSSNPIGMTLAAGSSVSYTGYLQAGRSAVNTGTCSGLIASNETGYFKGQMDEIGVPGYGSATPGGH